MKRKSEKSLNLTESEVRSIIKSELRLAITERVGMGGMELSLLVGDAMLDGLREAVVMAARNPDVRAAVKSAGQIDSRRLAEKIANTTMNDPDFKVDLVGLVAAMIQRSMK